MLSLVLALLASQFPSESKPSGLPEATRGRVVSFAPEIGSSGVDRDALIRYMIARKAAIVACYEKALRADPSLKVTVAVVVRFSIAPSGQATEIAIEDKTLGSE